MTKRINHSLMVSFLFITLISIFLINHSYALTFIDHSNPSCNESYLIINLTPHSPFNISSNSALATYSISGNGSVSNPYIIGNYLIDSPNFGIMITGTTLHFEIRDNHITAGYVAIFLDNVAANTAKIENNTCISDTGDGGGIGLNHVQGCIINNNTCENFMQGIHLNYGSLCHITNNTIINSNYQGINIRYSNSNTISHNLIQNSTEHGLTIVGSSSLNIIYQNIFNNNSQVETYTIDGERTGTIASQGYDEGSLNKWYDEVNEIGNCWSDYKKGSYKIDGPSNAFDLYPQKCSTNNSSLIINSFILSFVIIAFSIKLLQKRKI
ncbi:MAG: NosD domain-containing protein [Candidatus Thorarchaeota archaeon]